LVHLPGIAPGFEVRLAPSGTTHTDVYIAAVLIFSIEDSEQSWYARRELNPKSEIISLPRGTTCPGA